MPSPGNAERFGATAQALHWATFVLVATGFGVGLWMAGLPVGPQRFRAVPWHKAIGVTILALTLVRLAWRWRHPAPPLPATMPRWEQHAAQSVHVLLYVLLVAVPLTGWLMSSALGFSTVVFGIRLPDPLARDRELGDTLKVVHFALNKTLLAAILLHAAAAIKHRLIDNDGVLHRMLPWRARTEEKS